MSIGAGIAITGIWISVEMIGLKSNGNGDAAGAALFAAFATWAVAVSG